mmetsp:Transcript_81169/g.173702  ORF Transcript_81169/g.173702 Transcript_81169/m.173702 type:complete len:223 (+) Transcript_81169:378-1046(+)
MVSQHGSRLATDGHRRRAPWVQLQGFSTVSHGTLKVLSLILDVAASIPCLYKGWIHVYRLTRIGNSLIEVPQLEVRVASMRQGDCDIRADTERPPHIADGTLEVPQVVLRARTVEPSREAGRVQLQRLGAIIDRPCIVLAHVQFGAAAAAPGQGHARVQLDGIATVGERLLRPVAVQHDSAECAPSHRKQWILLQGLHAIGHRTLEIPLSELGYTPRGIGRG